MQATLLLFEAICVALFVLGLFRLRRRLGLSPLYATIGAFQFLQVVLALSLIVEVTSRISVSPGSAILFPATLCAVLLVYMWEDATEARTLIYSIVLANLTVSVLSLLAGYHLTQDGATNLLHLPRELFVQNMGLMALGTGMLWVDAILIIIVFEALSRVWKELIFPRVFLSLVLVLALDTVVFNTAAFAGRADFINLLVSGIVGKAAASLVFGVLITAYVDLVEHPGERLEMEEHEIRDVFRLLTYRQRFEQVRKMSTRDPLTGIFNRGYFDSYLASEMERARRYDQHLSLLIVDADKFKSVNDRYGHQEGDRVLQFLARVMSDTFRAADVVCRFGGEEFTVVLPRADLIQARDLADRLRNRIADMSKTDASGFEVDGVTVTVGVASFPADAEFAGDLVAVADRRLYAGKAGGRNCVVAYDPLKPPRLSIQS